MIDKDKFRHRLREMRKEYKLTQAELAESAGLSTQVISNWERGYSQPNKDEILLLVWQLGVGADYLLGLSDNPYDRNHYYNIDLLELLSSNKNVFFGKYNLTEQEKRFVHNLIALALNHFTEEKGK